MATSEIRVSVDEDAVARAAATIREAGRQLAETMGKLEGYAVERWTIETPRGRRYGYLDDYNQEHWMSTDGVRLGWRKLYVEKMLP